MDTRDALLRRVTLSRPDAYSHGLHYEDILLGLSELYSPAVAEEVRGLVQGPVRPDAFNYPVADLLRLCDVAALTAGRQSGHGYGDILEQLGAFSIRRFLGSPLGRALWMRAPREVHECLKWSLVSMRTAHTHGQRTYEQLGPTAARLVFRGELMGPAWVSGIFLAGLQVLFQHPFSASIENLVEPGLDFALRFTW
jgi:uncharacterized protein (TIGR02265 family)